MVDVAGGVLANDDEQPAALLTATADMMPLNGALSLGPDGAFTYEPDPGFEGQDFFTYFVVANLAPPPRQVTYRDPR